MQYSDFICVLYVCNVRWKLYTVILSYNWICHTALSQVIRQINYFAKKMRSHTFDRLRRTWIDNVMISIEGTLRLQLLIKVKMVCVAPLFTRCSQLSGTSLVAVSSNKIKILAETLTLNKCAKNLVQWKILPKCFKAVRI